jgi:hypothetical protein
MATRARNAYAEFFDAATKVLDEKDLAAKRHAAELRRTQAAQARFQREHAKKVHDSFADYRRDLAPLLQALEGLPARKGEKFMVRMEQQIQTRSSTDKEGTRSLNIWIAYAKPIGLSESKLGWMAFGENSFTKIETDMIPMPRNGVSDKLDVYPAKTGRDVVHIQLANEKGQGEKITGGIAMFRHHDTIKSMKDIPAYIGKWVAKNAPERLDDLRKSLGVKPAIKSKPVSPR